MTTLYDALLAYGKSDAYPFHMPGHKRQVKDFVNPFLIDITEIDGFDNLHHPEGILKEAQERAAEVYGSRSTYFLINGSTCGILSAVSALVRPGGEIGLARNCHKASYHACYLGDLVIHSLYPQWEPNFGINGGILPEDVEKLLEEYPKTQAVLITSPTYDGAVSDVKGISEICHAHGIPLIVDEAHGAHLGFCPYFPESALKLGADVVIQSFHKTLPSLTQTAVLHVSKSTRVDEDRIRRFLGIYQSSSPSYIFMAAMDRCVEFLKSEGKGRFEAFAARLEAFYAFARGLERIRVPGYEIRGNYGIFDFDRSKILLVPDAHGGEWLAEELRKKAHLELEMAAGDYGLALTSVMDTEEGFERLKGALKRIDEELAGEQGIHGSEIEAGVSAYGESSGFWSAQEAVCEMHMGNVEKDRNSTENDRMPQKRSAGYDGVVHNEIVSSLREAYDGEKETVLLQESEGRISGEFLYLYPPGIPILMPGERISREVLERVAFFREEGLSIQGLRDYRAENIDVLQNAEEG